MAKRKRTNGNGGAIGPAPASLLKKRKTVHDYDSSIPASTTIQVIVGTYDKLLHGITATISSRVDPAAKDPPSVEFADTFLLSPHSSAIRCLAISPLLATATKSQKVILASGSSDQVINLFHISTNVQHTRRGEDLSKPTLAGRIVLENPQNRALGSLEHHSGSVNTLYFPSRSKLLSAAEDSTIAVTRTRDWTVLSTIKAPIPRAHGRPSGDTAPLGGAPAGINDFAVHPSMKLMVSVGKGEKCMRLWNLVTGKKAGVLSFAKGVLQGVGERRWASGEGRKVEWDELGEEFVIGFERGCVVYGIDSKPKCRILPSPSSKIHQLHYLDISMEGDQTRSILAISTEDGRVIFYSTRITADSMEGDPNPSVEIPICPMIGQLGGVATGVTGRIKDFELLDLEDSSSLLIVTASSDGAIRLWLLDEVQLTGRASDLDQTLQNGSKREERPKEATAPTGSVQLGVLLGTYEAGSRITCLKAFVMSLPKSHEMNDSP